MASSYEVSERFKSFNSMEPITIFSQFTTTAALLSVTLTLTRTSVASETVLLANLYVLSSSDTCKTLATARTLLQISQSDETSTLPVLSFMPDSLPERNASYYSQVNKIGLIFVTSHGLTLVIFLIKSIKSLHWIKPNNLKLNLRCAKILIHTNLQGRLKWPFAIATAHFTCDPTDVQFSDLQA